MDIGNKNGKEKYNLKIGKTLNKAKKWKLIILQVYELTY